MNCVILFYICKGRRERHEKKQSIQDDSPDNEGRPERKPFASYRKQQGPNYYDKFQAIKRAWTQSGYIN